MPPLCGTVLTRPKPARKEKTMKVKTNVKAGIIAVLVG
jgi:hypothetical protein